MKKLLMIIFCCSTTNYAYSNTGLKQDTAYVQVVSDCIRGVILDEAGLPIVGATIRPVADDKKQKYDNAFKAITDLDGKFEIKADKTLKFVVSCPGYYEAYIYAEGGSFVKLRLKQNPDAPLIPGYKKEGNKIII